MQKEKRKKIITAKGYKEYQQILQHKKISKIMQTGNLQNQYDICSQAIEDNIKKVEKVTKKKDLMKDVKELIRMRKKIRKEFQAETSYYNKTN